MVQVALCIIATGKYDIFLDPLLASARKFFLPNIKKHFFLFTDSEKDFASNDVTIFKQNHFQWPGPAMYRYHIINRAKQQLSEYDYIFYSDADMLFVDIVGKEVLSPLTACNHPGFYNKPRKEFTYETNPKSKAYIPPDKGEYYFASGFNGGTSSSWLKMASVIQEWTEEDRKCGIIPVWHDESYFNRYLIENQKPSVILDPSYCFPESWKHLPYSPKLYALDKNHAEMRSVK